MFLFKVAQDSNISVRSLPSKVHFSALDITGSPKGSWDNVEDLEFAKLTTNMVVQDLLRKTLFPPSLVSCCLQYCLFLTSNTSIFQVISNGKTFLTIKSQCWNINKNCDVDVAIDQTSYQCKLGVSMWKWVLASELEGDIDNTCNLK